jgi:tetratricopeptide (TPR) repeat protein
LFLEKLPFFALSLASCVVTFCIQAKGGAVAAMKSLPLDARVANAVSSYFGYVRKTFWPSDLAVFYPYTAGPSLAVLVLMGALLVGVTVAVVRLAPSRPYLAVGWFWFAGMLVPVIGLVQVGVQSMADRYTYLPLIGLFVAIAWGAGDLIESARRGRKILIAMLIVALAGCVLTTQQQLRYWQNGVALFTRALAVTPNNAIAQYGLGAALVAQGKTDDACEHFAEAVQLDPKHADALNNLGLCFVLQGDHDAGLDCYRKALAVKPDYPEAHYNLGLALAARGDRDGAIEEYRQAIRFNSGFADAYAKLGLALAHEGKFAEAATHFREALRLRPDAQTHHNFAGTLVLLGNGVGAREHYREAVRLKPDWPEPLNLLAWLLATHGNQAVRDGAEAVRLAEQACVLSGHTNANFLATLAAAYAESGRFIEAVETSGRSAELAIAAGQSEFAEAERRRLALYRMNQPFHQE